MCGFHSFSTLTSARCELPERVPQLFGCELAAVCELLEPCERDAELVEALAHAFVGARALRRRTDALAREPIRQRWMVVEIADQRG